MIQIFEGEFKRIAFRVPSIIWIGQERNSAQFIIEQLYAQMMGWA